MPHHIFNPGFFNDSIAMFSTTYDWYVCTGMETDATGKTRYTYTKERIFGSLQPHVSTKNYKTSGNTTSMTYDFYCRSIYRIDFNDFIYYDGKYLLVDSVSDYDLGGVRQVTLTMVNLNSYRDFRDYLKVLNGDKEV